MNAEIGKAVFFAGPLKHAGFPITKGTRNILVLFLYVEDFHYGPLIQNFKRNHLDEQKQQRQTRSTEPEGGITVFRNHTVPRNAVVGLKLNNDQPKFQNLNPTLQEQDEDLAGVCDEEVGDQDRDQDTMCPKILNSGGEERGYVVYRQTVELVNMLESSSLADDC